MQPLPPWPISRQEEGDTSSGPPTDGPPSEDQVARWLLELGGSWHLCGRSLLERHLVSHVEELPQRVSALLGAKLPVDDPRTDAILARLAQSPACRGLQQLDLSHTAVDTAGLEQIGQWAWLESIDLAHTQVSLEDLAPLKNLPELRQLNLEGTALGALDYGDLFGQIDVPPALRHPIAAVQRALARLLDLQLAGLLVLMLLPAGALAALPFWAHGSAIAALAALLLMPLEGFLLGLLGSTPGKRLLRVSIIGAAGPRPSFGRSLQRAFLAGVLGYGAGVRPFSWLAGGYRAAALARGERMPWDRLAKSRCLPRQCSGKRLLIGLGVNLTLLLL